MSCIVVIVGKIPTWVRKGQSSLLTSTSPESRPYYGYFATRYTKSVRREQHPSHPASKTLKDNTLVRTALKRSTHSVVNKNIVVVLSSAVEKNKKKAYYYY